MRVLKTLGNVLVLLLALLGVALSAMLYLQYHQKPEFHFASYAEMQAAGMLDAGWLPDYLPASAKNIRGQYDIDTNEVWAEFNFNQQDQASVRQVCSQVAENERGEKYLCPPLQSRTSTLILSRDGSAHYRSYPNGL